MLPEVVTSTSHPCLALVHIVLKILVVATFLILPWFVNTLTVLEVVVILAAVDYWVVKNLSGRLLVGLRWWVDFDELGEEHWKFECKVNERDVNPANEKVFWWTLVLFSLIWSVLLVINVLRLDIQNITICLFCGSTLVFNLYSFYKCSKVQSENIKKLAAEYGTNMARRFLTGSIIANFI